MNPLQNYRIIEWLGGGAQGDVCRARQLNLERDVAIKFLKKDDVRDPVIKERFIREAKMLARVDHPNVVRVHDTGVDDEGRPYIVMEFLSGQPLADRITQQKKLSEHEAIKVTKQILSGLAEAHHLGIVHRDIKPSNIYIAPNGKLKILDFGIAKVSDFTGVTLVGKAIGTPPYMSPEQTQGLSVTSVSDIYSVGIVLYEMLVGQVPFRGSSTEETMAMQINAPVPSLANVVMTPLTQIVYRALEKKPGKRFQSANEMIEALDKALLKIEGQVKIKPPKTVKSKPDLESRANTVSPHSGQAGVRAAPNSTWIYVVAIALAGIISVLAVVGLQGGFSGPTSEFKVVTETDSIPFQVERQPTDSLAKGRSRIQREGKLGSVSQDFKVEYTDGKEIGRKPIGEPVQTRAIDQVLLFGTSRFVYCDRGHRDDWKAKFCDTCGRPLPPITEQVIE